MSSNSGRPRLRTVLGTEVYEWVQMLLSGVPGRVGVRLRAVLYRHVLARVGPGFSIGIRCRIQCPGAVSIGSRTGINDNAWIAANSDPEGWISIGNDVLIGPSVVIHTGNHEFRSAALTVKSQGHRFAPVIIEDDVWMAARVTILAGVTVAAGTVVAAGAVVTRSTEPYSVVAGAPAQKIASRASQNPE